MNKKLCFVFAALMTVPAIPYSARKKSPAQSVPPANPITTSEKTLYSFVSGAVIRASGENAGRQLLLQTYAGDSQF